MTGELRLDGRVAIVTGGGRGIGRSHCLALAARGASVLVNDLGGAREGGGASTEPATQVVAQIEAAGGRAVANFDDITDPDAAARIVAQAIDELGGLHIVVNNAGVFDEGTPFGDTDLAQYERFWRVHLGGTVNVTKAAWPHLCAQHHGRVINTSSCAAFYGHPGGPAYSAAKAAIHGFTLSLAHESQQHGIGVNAIAPAGLTRMASEFSDREALEAMSRILDPDFVSPVVVWLAHDSCDANGQVYVAGGGRVARLSPGEPEGHWQLPPTPESIAEHRAEIESREDLVFATDDLAFAGWLVENHQKRFAG